MFKAEDLANWYLRLNGFLTIPNFILHPDNAGSQRTDADVVGLRFPFRNEFEGDSADDPKIRLNNSKPFLIIVEVKSSSISINDTWQDQSKENINKLLESIGLFSSAIEIEEVANKLYNTGSCDNAKYYCSLGFIGNTLNNNLPSNFSNVPNILWKDIIHFIHRRFRRYGRIKRDHQQWDYVGKTLFSLVNNSNLSVFEDEVRKKFNLPNGLKTYQE